VQGKHVDALDDSYYHTDLATVSAIMRPSETLNASLENFNG
jgi:monomeric isocitrate dehydrogenase